MVTKEIITITVIDHYLHANTACHSYYYYYYYHHHHHHRLPHQTSCSTSTPWPLPPVELGASPQLLLLLLLPLLLPLMLVLPPLVVAVLVMPFS